MSKKKVVEYKYNIVSKKPKGQQSNVIYTVEYQENHKAEIKTIRMVNIDFLNQSEEWQFANGWAFMDGRESEKVFKDNEDRKDFLREFIAFQKGGSYRKTHPIVYTEKESLKMQIEDLKRKLSKIEQDEHDKDRDKYLKKVNAIDVNKFLTDINKAMAKHKIALSVFEGKLVLKDIENNIPIRHIIPVVFSNDKSRLEYKADKFYNIDADIILAHSKDAQKYIEE